MPRRSARNMNHTLILNSQSSWNIHPSLFIAQILNFIIAVVWIWASFKMISFVCKKGQGSEVPLWVLIIVLLPIVGALASYIHYKNKATKDT